VLDRGLAGAKKGDKRRGGGGSKKEDGELYTRQETRMGKD